MNMASAISGVSSSLHKGLGVFFNLDKINWALSITGSNNATEAGVKRSRLFSIAEDQAIAAKVNRPYINFYPTQFQGSRMSSKTYFRFL